jgi:hypothetical protein
MRRLTGRPQFRLPRLRGTRPRLPRTARSRVLAVIGVLFVILVLWAVWDLRSARNELLAARRGLSAAAGNLGNATDASAATTLRSATRSAMRRTESAEARITGSPVLRVASVLPGFSTQRRGAIRAVRTARAAAGIGDALAAVAETERAGLTVNNGAVDPVSIRRLALAASKAGRDLAALPDAHSDAQWGPLGHATSDLDDLLANTANRLVNGGGVMRTAADLLGASGPRRIFIALLNNAEMRDQGMVLSYAVAETSDGGFHLTRSGSVLDIPVPRAVTDVKVPEGTTQVFGGLAPTSLWQSINATADTALSGALARSMYREATGETVDGVVALDVPALAALLSVTGPVDVVGIPEPIDADNVAEILLDDLYKVDAGQSFHDARSDRLEQLAATTAAVVDKIRSSSVNATAVVKALGNAARGGHTWVSAANPDDQRDLERGGLSGAPGRVHPERTLHLSVQNGTATKLDYFVDPEVDVDVAITQDGTALLNTTVKLKNKAPVPTPASEQFGPDGFVTTVPGQYRARVYFWGPSTADQLLSVPESGLRLNLGGAEVLPGKTAEVHFSTVLPQAVKNGKLQLRFVPQARVRPMKLRVHVSAIGRKVDDATRSMDWAQVAELEWKVH